MNGYAAFLKKEMYEFAKTYRLIIMLALSAVFGIANPLVAKLTPEILESLMTDGIVITIPEPTVYDSWQQFFKNATQMGLIVMVILFSGVMSTELAKGTLINLLTKGLSRAAVILSKYTCMVLVWTASIVLSFGLTYGYTLYLFPGEEASNLLFSVFCLWLFGLFLQAVILLSAVITKTGYGCLLITGAAAAACMIADIIPAAHRYNPVSLAADNMALITGAAEPSSLCYAILVSCMFSVIFVLLSLSVFRKKQL